MLSKEVVAEHHTRVAGDFDEIMKNFNKNSEHMGDQLIFSGDNSTDIVTADIVTIVQFPSVERGAREVRIAGKLLKRKLSHIKNVFTSSPADHTLKRAH